MKSFCIGNVCERNLAWRFVHIEEALVVENLSKISQMLPVFRRKHVAIVESNKHTLWNRLETLISIWKRPEFFPVKQESQEKTLNLTEQLTVVSVLIRIFWDSIRGAFNMLRSAVMRLHFEIRRCGISSKTVCKRLEGLSFGSKECGNIYYLPAGGSVWWKTVIEVTVFHHTDRPLAGK